ncbi:hypothetical protein JCM3774_001430 [Rhodotorula dairenensis]
MSTWAKLAATAPDAADAAPAAADKSVEPATASSSTTSTPTPPAAAQRRQSTSKPKSHGPSKASTSDNWRASARANTETPAAARSADQRTGAASSAAAKAKADTTDEDGWEKVTKKEKAAPASAAAPPQARGKKQAKEGAGGKKADARRAAHAGHESSGTDDKGKGASSAATKANGHKEAAIAPKKEHVTSAVRPSLKPAQSWADDDGSGRLPSPNFGAVASPAVAVAAPLLDDHAVEDLALPPSAAPSRPASPPPTHPDPSNPAVEVSTPSESDAQAHAEAEVKPPAPKVNVWSVRKEQLAQAVPAPAPVPTGAEDKESKEPVPAAAAQAGKEKKDEATKGSKKDEARRSQPKKSSAAAANEAPAAKAKTPATAGARQGGGSSAGWSSTSVKQKGPVVVAGEDATSWPAPVEAVKELDEAAKAKQDQESKPKTPKTSGAQKKKKGEKKWVPLKTEITVAPSGPKSRGKGVKPTDSKAGSDKKGAAATTQADSQAKGKSATGPSQHPLPAKPTAAASPTAHASSAKQSGAAANAASAQSSSGSSPVSPSGPDSSHPSAASDAAAATPATTAASSADGAADAAPSTSAHVPPTPAGQGQGHGQQAGFAGRGRGRGGSGAPTRGTRGRGGMPPANNPNRFFHQQQQAAMQAVGYVPVPADLDPTGTGVLDAYGNPVPVPVINPAAGPVQIDPRMLDPTRYWLLGQIEWWFSVDNLCRDLFLRQSMDTAGWIPISLIASFNRIKNLTNDIKIVVECMRMTPLLEVSPRDRFVRLAQTWPQWVLPNAQTNEDVKKDFEEASKAKADEAEPAPKEATAAASTLDEKSTPAEKDSAPQTNGDVVAESANPENEDVPTPEQESESAIKVSPPPRRGSPPASLAPAVLDVAVSAVVTVSAPPKPSS